MESDPLFDEAAEDVAAASICAFHVADRRMAVAHYNVRTVPDLKSIEARPFH